MAEYLLLLVPKEPKFSRGQFQTIIDICVGVGLIGIGSMAVPAFLGAGNIFQIIAGLMISLTLWYTALRIAKEIL